MYYIGLDVGTSSLKSTIIDEQKNIVYESSANYETKELKGGYREIHPDVWFRCVMQELKTMFQQFKEEEISVIGVSGQMHTTVFLDGDGNVIRDAILWNDMRSTSIVKELKEKLSKRDDTSYIARIISTGCPAINSLWMKRNEPENFQRLHKIMSAYDYIVFRLTGEYSADYCDASTSSLYDIEKKIWSPYMLETLGIDESYVGPLHASCDVIGLLTPSVCEQLHITHAIRIIAGTGDNPANAFAMGTLNQRKPVISLGTSGVVIVPKEDGDFEGIGKNVLFQASQEGFVNVVQGTVRSAGGTHKWWVENILKSDDMSIDQIVIHPEMIANNTILFFPHLTGDKLIYQDINTRGAFIGLSVQSKREDMLQALFEGVSYALKEVLENMNLTPWPKRIQINGGGSKSAIWMEIMANILDCELEVVSMKATPSFGACLLARMVDFVEDHVEEQQKEGTLYYPTKNYVQAYRKSYKRYKKMYQALEEIME